MQLYLVLILLLSATCGSLAELCYQCDSTLHGNCADPFDGSGIHQTACPYGCQKVKEEYKEATGRITRGCVVATVADHGCSETKKPDSGVSDAYWCTCEGELCNHAPRPSSSQIPLFMGLAAILLMRILF
ncbi:uncharacterized protein LOC106176964 [Lingula anatina]|uniref:Uncharacterized protein LOC106176964 n=1 Tax=Lingula anatina TaxID=7574 RepID=A0A1S3JY90_LINAN|nr:uncharacterized protein LOC106176964 [Lingula anatina]|eukprot:XP_013415019.1 uncharacterized protein LOC106176964 [Lingula anatina]